MLFLVVQNRIFNLKGEDIVHLAAALPVANGPTPSTANGPTPSTADSPVGSSPSSSPTEENPEAPTSTDNPTLPTTPSGGSKSGSSKDNNNASNGTITKAPTNVLVFALFAILCASTMTKF
nr:hypothetical protein [Tanacetum cinerariifolium]